MRYGPRVSAVNIGAIRVEFKSHHKEIRGRRQPASTFATLAFATAGYVAAHNKERTKIKILDRSALFNIIKFPFSILFHESLLQ